MSKQCQPDAFEGYCQEHHIPIEKCWEQPNPSPSQGELDEDKLVRLGSLVGTDARNPEANLVAYVREVIAAETDRARRDELSHVQLEYGHYVAQTYVNGQAMTIEERIASLEDEDATKK